MTDDTAAIRIHGARYVYPATSVEVLNGVDLEVGVGEIVGLVGPNDAGKTTLCLVAAGLAPQAIGGRLRGDVVVDGTPTVELRPHELAQRIGIVFQNPLTQLSGTTATVWEEIAFGPRNLGLSIREVVDRVTWAISVLGLEAIEARDPHRLSGGQGQLVALASILAMRPRCLVLDEPTSQLDPVGTRLVGDALARIAAGGETAVLVVEHKTDLLLEAADRVALLEGGEITRVGAAREVLGEPALEAAGVEPPSRLRLERLLAGTGRTSALLGLATP